MYGGASAPTGWLLCDGTAYSRTVTYSSLFAAIGTAYGVGDGSTTFNVPDLRSRSALGSGTGTKILTFSSRASNTVTVTGSTNSSSNEVQTGQAAVFHANGGSITGLVDTTTYYLIRIAFNQIQLATTRSKCGCGNCYISFGEILVHHSLR